jgi:multidrug resistance efflux pump
VAGAISEVPVDDNLLLKKGDPIARPDPRDYEMALAQVGANLTTKSILISGL